MADFIEQAQQEALLRFGRELSPDEMAEKFAANDIETRIMHLKSLNRADELTLSEAVRLSEYEGALLKTHELLRKADR